MAERERGSNNPVYSPDAAAHDVVLELCQAGAFSLDPEYKVMGTGDGEALAESVIAFHQKLAAYYRTLKDPQ